MNHAIEVVSSDKIVVDLVGDLREEREAVLLEFVGRTEAFQADETSRVYPLDLDRMPRSGRHFQTREMRPWKPVLTPGVDDQRTVQPHPGIPAAAEPESECPRSAGLDFAAPAYRRDIPLKSLREGIVDIRVLIIDR